MKIYKNMLLAFGFLLSGSLVAMTDQVQVAQPEVAASSFIDKVKNVEWMKNIDGAKKGFTNGLFSEGLAAVAQIGLVEEAKLDTNDPLFQVGSEAVALLLDAMTKESQGAEYVGDQVGRILIPLLAVFMMHLNKDGIPLDAKIVMTEAIKSSVQRLCASSVDDFKKDPKAIVLATTKTAARFAVELLRVVEKKAKGGGLKALGKFSAPDTHCFASAGVNAFLPLAIDGGLAVAGDKFDLSIANQKRISRVSKSVVRVVTGILCANNQNAPRK